MATRSGTSLEKGLNILRLLSSACEGMTVSELSTALSYPASTVVRLLQVLKRAGYVWQERRRSAYRASYDILELAGNMLKNIEVRQAARPYLHELAAKTALIAQLKVPSGIYVVVVDVAIPPLALPLTFDMGSRMIMHTSTLGKAILAFREDTHIHTYIKQVNAVASNKDKITDAETFLNELCLIRERGYAIRYTDVGSFHSLAAPILRYDGWPIAAIGIGGGFGFTPEPRSASEQIAYFVQEVTIAARRLSFAMGYQADRLAGESTRDGL